MARTSAFFLASVLRVVCRELAVALPEVPHLLRSCCRRACMGKQQPPNFRPSFTSLGAPPTAQPWTRLARASLLMHATVCLNKC